MSPLLSVDGYCVWREERCWEAFVSVKKLLPLSSLRLLCGGFLIRAIGNRVRQVFVLLSPVSKGSERRTSQASVDWSPVGREQPAQRCSSFIVSAFVLGDNFAGTAIDAERHLNGQLTTLVDVDCMRCVVFWQSPQTVPLTSKSQIDASSRGGARSGSCWRPITRL